MKTEEAIKDIECIVVGQDSLLPVQRKQIKTVLESYAKEIAEAQREACSTSIERPYYDRSVLQSKILNTPLVTVKQP